MKTEICTCCGIKENEDGDGVYPVTVKIVGKGSLYGPKNEKVRT